MPGSKLLISWLISPFDQEYSYGGFPPEIFKLIIPSFSPKQEIFVTDSLIKIGLGVATLKVCWYSQSFSSVIVIV